MNQISSSPRKLLRLLHFQDAYIASKVRHKHLPKLIWLTTSKDYHFTRSQ